MRSATAPGEREEQQREGGADGEGHRQRTVSRPRTGRAGDDDRGEHRSGARHVQHAERKSQPETASLCSFELRNAAEGLFEHLLEPREDQPEADDGQRDESGPADGVLRQMQQRQRDVPTRVTRVKLSTRPAITR